MDLDASIFFIVLFIVFLLTPIFSVYSQQTIGLELSDCPQNLFVNERHMTQVSIKNSGSHSLNILSIDLSIDGFENANNSSKIIFPFDTSFPLTLSSFSSERFSIKFSAPEEGIHYVDALVSYYSVENPEKVTQEIHELCRFEVRPIESLWNPFWLTVMIGAITSGFGGALAYGVKRYFLKKDTQHKKDLDHQNWLLQQMHSLAEKYYFPLAKFSLEIKRAISIAAPSKKLEDIKSAYYKTSIFVDKYLEFKENTGANFIFRNNRAAADDAMSKIQAVFVSLPFDERDFNQILREFQKAKESKTDIKYNTRPFRSFKNWINSTHCEKSRDMVMKKSFKLQQILDKQGERISNPDFIKKLDKQESNLSTKEAELWILRSSTKYVKQGDEVHIFGAGFTKEGLSFKLHLGDEEFESEENFEMLLA